MRILLVTQWFDPEPTLKGLAFANLLAARGHEVEVLTGFPNYPGGLLYPGWTQRLWKREVHGAVRVVRVPLYPSHDHSAIGRTANYLTFAVSAAVLGPLLTRRPDVVYGYHPPITAGIAAAMRSMLSGAPLVLDVQDLWPDSVTETGMLEGSLTSRLLNAMCDWVYGRSRRVVTLSSGMRDALVMRGVPPDRVRVIANWSPDDTAADTPRVSQSSRGTFTVLFAGTMGVAQGMDTVLDAALICRDRAPQVRFVLIGGGIDRDRIASRISAEGMSNVELRARAPMNAMPAILESADALLVHLLDRRLFRITIPSKTQAYLRAGKPIIMAVAGDAATIVADAGAGVVVPPSDPAALAEAVMKLSASDPMVLRAMGERGRQHYHAKLNFAIGSARFAEVLEGATEAA